MSNCTEDQCTPEQVNTNNCSTDECCDMPEQLLELADEAWNELLREKMKAKIEESCGEKLDELAALVTTANSYRWQQKIQGKVKCDEYKSSIKEFFTNCGCDE